MRLLACVVLAASLAGSGAAAAQSWEEYSYPEDRFAVTFPAAPRIETTTFEVAAGRSVAARRYGVQQPGALLTVTVAELANTGLAETAVIDHAIARVAAGGEIKVNIPHRIDSVYGRQLSVLGADGSRAAVALFDYKGRLYQIEGRALPGAGDAATDTLRFQQSLVFTDGGSNRSPAAIHAIQEACRGVANPAGLDDPRCKAVRK
jgi:hypothetical protein